MKSTNTVTNLKNSKKCDGETVEMTRRSTSIKVPSTRKVDYPTQ